MRFGQYENVKELAESAAGFDPRAALQLLDNPTIRKDFQMTFEANTGVLGSSATQELKGKFACDYFVYDMAYVIWTPNYLAGSTFKKSEDNAGQVPTYLGIQLEIQGCPEVTITDGVQPLELTARPANVPMYGASPLFALWFSDTLQGQLFLRRPFSATEIPMTVTLVTHGLLLSCRRYDYLDIEEALQRLYDVHQIKVKKEVYIAEKIRAYPPQLPTNNRR
jgi:hypothetical protein